MTVLHQVFRKYHSDNNFDYYYYELRVLCDTSEWGSGMVLSL